MPTYTVTNSNFNLSSKQQQNLAEGITKVHNVITGANTYFAQVVFNKTKKNNHFMGGKKVKEQSLFLLGQIRAGRSKEVKDKLISDLKDVLIKNSKLEDFDYTMEQSEEGFKNFTVIKCKIKSIEWLYLAAKGPRRAKFDLENAKDTWLIP